MLLNIEFDWEAMKLFRQVSRSKAGMGILSLLTVKISYHFRSQKSLKCMHGCNFERGYIIMAVHFFNGCAVAVFLKLLLFTGVYFYHSMV